tara:strand:+ start:322 stop:657 length:336 start_codon:yes stop_codon:yes gene_type:complete
MKSFLIFRENGEIEMSYTDTKILDIKNFNYEHVDRYNKLAILYNIGLNKNITIFPFTDKVYNGDILLFKLEENNKIKSLKIKDYEKILVKIKEDINDIRYTSSSEEESFSF